MHGVISLPEATSYDKPDAADLMGILILSYNAKIGNSEAMQGKSFPFGVNNL